MVELVEQYLRLGLVHFMAYPQVMEDESALLPTVERVAHMPEFRCIELKLVEDERRIEPLKQLLESAMLDTGVAAQPAILGGKLDPGSVEKKDRRRFLDILRRHVDQAIELNAECVALLSGPDPGPADRAEALRYTADTIADLCRYSEEREGPKIVLEVFDRAVDKKALVGPVDSVRELCDLVSERGAEHFGVCVDLSHLPLLGETPEEAIEPVDDCLACAHLGNAVLQQGHELFGDKHPGFGNRAGANRIDEVRNFINVLKNVGFLNRKSPPMVSFEVKPAVGEKSETVIAAALRVFRRAWAKA